MGPFWAVGGRAWGAGGYVRHKLKALTGKFGPKSFYKGNNARVMGRFRKTGGKYLVDWKTRVPDYRVPSGLDVTELRPYVSAYTPAMGVVSRTMVEDA